MFTSAILDYCIIYIEIIARGFGAGLPNLIMIKILRLPNKFGHYDKHPLGIPGEFGVTQVY